MKRAATKADSLAVARAPREHELKCWPEYYDAIVEGRKRFEIRDATYRDFRVGDRCAL